MCTWSRTGCRAEDGRSAALSQSKLKLSRWAEAHERSQGRIRCEQRVENNRLRRVGRRELPLKQPLCRSESDARYRRKGEIIGVMMQNNITMNGRIADVNERITDTNQRIDDANATMNQRFNDTNQRIDQVQTDIREIRGLLLQILDRTAPAD